MDEVCKGLKALLQTSFTWLPSSYEHQAIYLFRDGEPFGTLGASLIADFSPEELIDIIVQTHTKVV